jgi:hypothetical protein
MFPVGRQRRIRKMFTCPANHTSETPEFCSVCGLEIPGTAATTSTSAVSGSVIPAQVSTPPTAGDGRERCPDCAAPRDSEQHVFCEVCGYNFVTRVAGFGPPRPYMPAPTANSPSLELGRSLAKDPADLANPDSPSELAPRATAAAMDSDSTAASVAAARWELTLTVDANLYGAPNPEAPKGQPPRKFRLFDCETMIGRAGTEVRVQVPVQGDPGVSRRHVLLIEGPPGSLVLRDLNSANGTRVDGIDVLPGVDIVLHDGAVIAIGAWTSIMIRSIRVS